MHFELARAVGDLPAQEKLPALVALARVKDAPWIARALSASAADVAGPFVTRLADDKSSWLTDPSVEQVEALDYLGERWAGSPDLADAEACLDFLAGHPDEQDRVGQLAILAGAARAWQRATAGIAGGSAARDASRDPRLARLIEAAAQHALGEEIPAELRSLAVRVVGDIGTAEQVAQLLPLATGSTGGPAVDAAIVAICRRGAAALVRDLIDGWASYTPARRRLIASSALASTVASREFVDAMARGVVRTAEIDPSVRTAFEKSRDAAIAAQAVELFAKAAPAPRHEVLARYQPALELSGSREHGAKLFKEHCATCHTILGFGRQVGPDISGVAGRPKETLLGDILDPSRQVAPDFLNYSLFMRDGRVLAGLLVSDTGEAVTLRRGEGADDVVLRADIEELQASGKSLMPEGLEQRLSPQDMADVLSFLKLPERRLLEQK